MSDIAFAAEKQTQKQPAYTNGHHVVPKFLYLFNELPLAEKYVGGQWDCVRGLLGGKGANLAEMTRIGVPVPPGFTITTETCNLSRPKARDRHTATCTIVHST